MSNTVHEGHIWVNCDLRVISKAAASACPPELGKSKPIRKSFKSSSDEL